MELTQEQRDPNRITFYFNGVRRSITLEDALILSGWLHKTRSLAAGPLARRLDAETDGTDRPGIELSADWRRVLRELLSGADVGECAGLKSLAQTLQSEVWDEPVESERQGD
ncbi:MAG: hypothetical protein ACJ75G_07650 [Gaiellaceae bacterium]